MVFGSIAGDVIGSVYEFNNVKHKEFALFTPQSRFTDDTVLTVAVMDCLLNKKDYAKALQEWGQQYPNAGYGGMFRTWLWSEDPKPYNSYGNGSGMRVSPVGFARNSISAVLEEAEQSARVTHNHPEGIRGAQAIALAVFLARKNYSKKSIAEEITKKFQYDLTRTLDSIRPTYRFQETCQGSVPQAIRAFLESTDYEDAIRNAVSLGGDSDTIACMTGGIAQAYYKDIPRFIEEKVWLLLDPELRAVVQEFCVKYC